MQTRASDQAPVKPAPPIILVPVKRAFSYLVQTRVARASAERFKIFEPPFCRTFDRTLLCRMHAYDEMETDHFDTDLFIDEIQKRPAIWNMESPDYKNKIIKKRNWEEMVEFFCEPGDSLERKKNWYWVHPVFSLSLSSSFIATVKEPHTCNHFSDHFRTALVLLTRVERRAERGVCTLPTRA
ncbi:hypothetical protein EVAR_7058_1 [Eumeta japonica]|uniref:MADF domain-containing protein n=1 Tax=Eumeta variegata TaxID=151549 RepID=A0A4C1XD26_EUMVA|nr:hypothetical protein EVAR_7058_1 [Eumeta japonica]